MYDTNQFLRTRKHYHEVPSPSQIATWMLDEPGHILPCIQYIKTNNINAEDNQIQEVKDSDIPAFFCSEIIKSLSFRAYWHFINSSSAVESNLVVWFKVFCKIVFALSFRIYKQTKIHNQEYSIWKYLTSVESSLPLKSWHCRTWTLYFSCNSSNCCV